MSCALWHVYYPLLVVATYVIAPLPNWICGRAANPDDFMESAGNGVIDFGRFLTGFLVVMGIGTDHAPTLAACTVATAWLTLTQPTALPALLAHCALISTPAMVMSIIGGLLIYGTIISFTMFFQEDEEF